MSQLANLLDQAEAENKASDERATREVRNQYNALFSRIRELEGLLSECLDYPAGVKCCRLEKRIAQALGRKIR